MDEAALAYALKLLRGRDYSRTELGRRIERRFDREAEAALDWLERKGYLDDRRFAAGFMRSRPGWARRRIDAALEDRGVSETIRSEILASRTWPSAREIVRSRMAEMGLNEPLSRQAAARVARALSRMGHDPEEISEELERFL